MDRADGRGRGRSIGKRIRDGFFEPSSRSKLEAKREKEATLRTPCRSWTLPAVAVALLSSPIALGAQTAAEPPRTLSCGEIETFLKTAKIGRQREIPIGVTVPLRATLDNGSLRHDAAIQAADIREASYATARGTELNFRDTWKFNVAGYELAKMLELNMVPPYVERRVNGGPASLSWWVNDTMMEQDRVQRKVMPPDVGSWNDQLYAGRLFRELIGDSDFNPTNTLITKDWRVWLIDFSRAFRLAKTLQFPSEVTRVDRKLLTNLRALNRETLQGKLGAWLSKGEIDAVIARRDVIVGILEKQIATKGEAAIVYDLPRMTEACGTGL